MHSMINGTEYQGEIRIASYSKIQHIRVGPQHITEHDTMTYREDLNL